ncbi:MAG: hypothetical protein ACKOEO_20850, partial [Planctomycetaceae bacterium]
MLIHSGKKPRLMRWVVCKVTELLDLCCFTRLGSFCRFFPEAAGIADVTNPRQRAPDQFGV